MAKGFGGMPGNMQQMMKQAQKMQQELARVQEEAENDTAEGSAGGGMVKAVASGKNQIVSLTIEKDIIDPEDAEGLEAAIQAACNAALTNVQEKLKQKMSQATGGLNIPGLT